MTSAPAPRTSPSRRRMMFAVTAVLCVPLGLAVKRVSIGGIADHFGGSVYVVFWCFVAWTLWPRADRVIVPLTVFLATCAIEFSQLSDHPTLDFARGYRVGRMVLGSVFSWIDLPFYAIGAGLAMTVRSAFQKPQGGEA